MVDDNKKIAFSMPAPKSLQEAGFVIMALSGDIDHLLNALAEANGNVNGPWLDEIKQVLIRDAKGTVSESISIETEVVGMKIGIDLLDNLVERFRRRLISEKK